MNFKKLLSWGLIAAFFCAGTAVFAQKATVSYWGGQVQRKTYEPYYYELVELQDDLEGADSRYNLKNAFGFTSDKFPPSVCADNSRTNTQSQRAQYLKRIAAAQNKSLGEVEQRYKEVDNLMRQNYVLEHWAVSLGPDDQDDLNHMTAAQWALVKTVLGTQPKERAKRPEPINAYKITSEKHSWVQSVFVQFKASDGKAVYMRFNLAARDVEIYNAPATFWRTIKGKRTDLNDLKDWRKK